MEYRLNVTKIEKNPDYKENRPIYDRDTSPMHFEAQILSVVLNEEEYTAVKKSVIEVIK
jgi:hypothetical protein